MHGLVHDVDGSPIEGALVTVGKKGVIEKHGDLFQLAQPRCVQSEANGTFRVHQVVPKAQEVYVTAPGYAQTRTWWSGLANEGVRFVLTRGGSIAGVVLGEAGNPVAGAEVWTATNGGPDLKTSTLSGGDVDKVEIYRAPGEIGLAEQPQEVRRAVARGVGAVDLVEAPEAGEAQVG